MYDIDEVRRKAMGVLEKEACGPVAAAKRAGMSYSQWANLRSGALDSKTGKPRGMRKETARKIEAAFGRAEGWLDVDLSKDQNGREAPITQEWVDFLQPLCGPRPESEIEAALLSCRRALKGHPVIGRLKFAMRILFFT